MATTLVTIKATPETRRLLRLIAAMSGDKQFEAQERAVRAEASRIGVLNTCVVEDEIFAPMPKVCSRLLPMGRFGSGGIKECGGKIRPSGGFHKCVRCGVSYGPVGKKGKQ